MTIARAAFWCGLALAAVCAMVFVDVALRARSARLEAEKYLAFSRNPALKKAYFDAELAKQTHYLNAERRAGRIDDQELDARLGLAQFARDERLAENPLAYAEAWTQTADELFSHRSLP